MKYYITLIVALLLNNITNAQETAKRSGNLSEIVFEKYNVLKSDKKLRQGSYTATFKGNVIANGNYSGGKRTGSWNFYNPKGIVIQTFNYDSNLVTFADSNDNKTLKYFMERGQPTDSLTVPVKIGGSTYGYIPLVMARADLTKLIHADFPAARKVLFTHTLVVNEYGALISHQVRATIDDRAEKTYNLDDSQMDPDITRFIPATINHKPVMSKVITYTTSVFSGMVTRSF